MYLAGAALETGPPYGRGPGRWTAGRPDGQEDIGAGDGQAKAGAGGRPAGLRRIHPVQREPVPGAFDRSGTGGCRADPGPLRAGLADGR